MQEKHSQSPLVIGVNYFDVVQGIVDRLHEIPRTGYVDRGVQNPETVGEHTDELVVMAQKLFKVPGLACMLRIHDWPEIKTGDLRTDSNCPGHLTREEKLKAELAAMQEICSNLGHYGKTILRLWVEFEEEKTARAILAKQMDKIQRFVKAAQYEKAGEDINAWEFMERDAGKITNPILKEIMEQTKSSLPAMSV